MITIAGKNGSATVTATSGESVGDVIAGINNVSSQTGVYAQRATSVAGELNFNTITASGSLTLNGVAVNVSSGTTPQQLVDAINGYTAQTGVTASYAYALGTNTIILSNSTGADINFNATGGLSGLVALKGSGNGGGGAASGTFEAGIELYTQVGGSIGVSGNSALLGAYGVNTVGSSTPYGSFVNNPQTLTLKTTNVLTSGSAETAIKAMDFALNQISRDGGLLGALQSRFQATISNLQSAGLNTQAARSRIQDTNFAAQTTLLSQAQVLQQAGVAMVAQANTDPQAALALLK